MYPKQIHIDCSFQYWGKATLFFNTQARQGLAGSARKQHLGLGMAWGGEQGEACDSSIAAVASLSVLTQFPQKHPAPQFTSGFTMVTSMDSVVEKKCLPLL